MIENKFRVGDKVYITKYNPYRSSIHYTLKPASGEVYCSSGSYCTHITQEGKGYRLEYPNEHLIKLSDYEELKASRIHKHPFKTYYENGILPSDLNTKQGADTLKTRLVEFLSNWFNLQFFTADLEYFFPNVDTSHTDFVYMWLDSKGREKGRAGRVKMKPGRAFRKIFPLASDTQIEEMVEEFKKTFAPMELTVHQGDKAEDFLHAYTHDRTADRNFSTCETYKRMCDSCMRYDASYFRTDIHPVETYASGDWTIFWTENKDGEIASRCIAGKDENGKCQLGPIYATCQEGIDKLEGFFNGLDTTGIAQGDWDGARILKVEYNGGFVGPYFDLHGNLSEDGKYLVLDHSGDIEHHHEGIFYGGGCGWCEERNGETTYVESVNMVVCSCCLDYDFFISDFSNEYFPDDRRVEVYYSRTGYETWSEGEAGDHVTYSEDFGEYIREGNAVETCDGEYIPDWELSEGTWFICTEDGLAHRIEDMIEHDGKQYAKVNAPEDSEYYRCNETQELAV